MQSTFKAILWFSFEAILLVGDREGAVFSNRPLSVIEV
jgi:hypothetical protein